MANNLTIPVATDEVGGVHYQRLKLHDGTEDSTTEIQAGNGTAANALRVALASDSGTAHDAADAGNPLKVGAKAKAALSGLTLVAADDRTNLFADLDGALLVREDAAHGDLVDGNATNTDGTSTQCLAAGAAGIKHVLTDITLCNSSATPITVDIKDGSTVRWSFPVPAGGGVVFSWKKGLVGTAATAWNFDPSAAATTITCSMAAYKTKV